jgi:hypothetical protein
VRHLILLPLRQRHGSAGWCAKKSPTVSSVNESQCLPPAEISPVSASEMGTWRILTDVLVGFINRPLDQFKLKHYFTQFIKVCSSLRGGLHFRPKYTLSKVKWIKVELLQAMSLLDVQNGGLAMTTAKIHGSLGYPQHKRLACERCIEPQAQQEEIMPGTRSAPRQKRTRKLQRHA